MIYENKNTTQTKLYQTNGFIKHLNGKKVNELIALEKHQIEGERHLRIV